MCWRWTCGNKNSPRSVAHTVGANSIQIKRVIKKYRCSCSQQVIVCHHGITDNIRNIAVHKLFILDCVYLRIIKARCTRNSFIQRWMLRNGTTYDTVILREGCLEVRLRRFGFIGDWWRRAGYILGRNRWGIITIVNSGCLSNKF